MISDRTMLPLVKVRVITESGDVVIAQIEPAAARNLGGDLIETAGRASYEGDMFRLPSADGVDNAVALRMVGHLAQFVRGAEMRRHIAAAERIVTDEDGSDEGGSHVH